MDHEPRKRLDRFKGVLKRNKGTNTTKRASHLAEPDKLSKNNVQMLQTSQSGASAKVLLESQDLEPALDQGQPPRQDKWSSNTDGVTIGDKGGFEAATAQGSRPPQNEQGSAEGVTAEEIRSKDLWMHAYEILKLRDPELVAAFEGCSTSTDVTHTASASSALSPDLIDSIIKSKLEDHEAKRLVVRLGKEPIKVREQGEKIIRFIISSNTFISTAIDAQPFAALAWSGVSIILTLLLNSSRQSQAMIEGLSYISDLLRLYKYKELVYLQDLDKPAHPDFVKAIEELYANIFEYQVRLICYLSGSWIKRGVRGTMQLDDWKSLLETVKSSDDKCNQYRAVSSEEKVLSFYTQESYYIKQSLDIQNRVLDLLEASRTQERRNDQEASLLEALASDYTSDKDLVTARVPGTCEWFFEDERFQNWRDGKSSSLLWVSAGPGCGKSVLSRALVDERRVCSNVMTSSVCYFFFKDGQEQRTRGAHALSAILHQLFKNTNLISHAFPSHKSYGKKLRDVFSELWDILVRSAKDPEAGEIICILDALDECEEDARNQLIEKLISFFSQKEFQNFPFGLKFLVTSRPYDNIEKRFESLGGMGTYLHFDGDEKSQKIGQEINLVIDAKLPDIAGGFSDEDRKRISDRLKVMNNRTYLWLYLIIGIIEESGGNYGKASTIDKLLSNLPSKISDVYEMILAKSSDRDCAEILLQIIVAATRPLSLMEANIALTIATQRGYTSHKALDLWPLQNFKSFVRNVCGLFVSVHDGKLSLLHQTGREFLIRNTGSGNIHLSEWQGLFDIPTAHGTLSNICLSYLNCDEFAILTDENDDNHRHQPPSHTEARSELYPLLDYAANNWVIHYNSQHSESAKDSLTAAKSLCDTSLPQQLNWFQVYLEDRAHSNDEWTILGLASFFGLIHVVESLLNEGADCNAIGASRGEYIRRNVLHIASREGHEVVVRMLLEFGAHVNADSAFYGSTLRAASENGHEEVVQVLLKCGADVHSDGGYYGSILQATSEKGHEKVVRMLIQKGADVNAHSGFYGNALQAASHIGNEKLVRTLLQEGADVNALGGFYGNALQAASFMGHHKVVQALLEHGTHVGQKDIQGRTPLHLASAGGHRQMVEKFSSLVLDLNITDGQGRNCLHHAASGGSAELVSWFLEKGFDPNLADRDGWTALHWAAKNGSLDTVLILIRAGANSTIEAIEGWTPHSVAVFHDHSLDILDVLLTNKPTDSRLLAGQGIVSSAAAVALAGPCWQDDGGQICAGCFLGIYGTFYDCVECMNFCYCFKCKESWKITHGHHNIIKMAYPGGGWEFTI